MTAGESVPSAFLGLFGALLVWQSLRSPRTEKGTITHFWTLPLEVVASVVVLVLSVRDLIAAGAPSWPFPAAGAAILLGGSWLFRRAQHDLGPYWSYHIEVRPNQPLVCRGAYGWCRHPAYLGLMSEVVALPVALASPAGLAAALLGFVPVVVLRTWLEELALERGLGDAYRAYQRSTPLFIPRRRHVAAWMEAHKDGVRALFALAGVAVAAAGVLAADPRRWLAYLVVFALLGVSHFACVDLPPPLRVIALPHLAINAAFTYIIGLPVISLDYLAKLLTFRLMVTLHRLGISRPPAYLATLVEHASRGERPPRGAYVDHWANHAAGALGCAVRWAGFAALTGGRGLDPLLAILLSELAAAAALGLVNVLLPLPAQEWLAGTAGRSPEPALEVRADILFATLVFLPIQVFLIYYGFRSHGMLGAALWSLAAFGPHTVLEFLNRRRTTLVRRNEELVEKSKALEAANLALEEKARALHDKQEELRMLVYAVTHDLKDPLGAILLTAEQLVEEEKRALSAEGARLLERIAELAKETAAMVADLLELFRVTTTPEEVGTVDLGALVERARRTIAPQIAAKGVRVEVGRLPTVRGQAGKLGHAVTNLLSNAVKYAPAETGLVEVGGELREGDAVMWVRDNGKGIPPAYHGWIFELFGRVPKDEGGTHSGGGVGLAIVKRVVEAHGGRVWVESTPGKGASFYIRLPGGRAGGPPGPQQESPERTPPSG